MKKIVLRMFGGVILLSSLSFGDYSISSTFMREFKNKVASTVKEYGGKYAKEYRENKALEKPSRNDENRRKVGGVRLKYPVNYSFLFSKQRCNQVIDNGAYTACYDYGTKTSHVLRYRLDRNSLKSRYVKRGMDSDRFYASNIIPRKYRATPYDYQGGRRGEKYDKGHIRSYASSAYSKNLIYLTYSMINILPQTPQLNRYRWLKAEKYERYVAKKLGSVTVINIADYNGQITRIGNNVGVPVGFYKVILGDNDFKKCFYYRNTQRSIKGDKLRDHVIDCKKVYL